MNLQRSPPTTLTGSHPNLSVLTDEPISRITQRKRRNPHDFDAEDFKREINDTLEGIRSVIKSDIASSLREFSASFTSLFQGMISQQNESIVKLTTSMECFKSQILELQTSNTKLKEENKEIINCNKELRVENTNLNTKVSVLEKSLTESNKELQMFSNQILLKEQQDRLNNLEIAGIPENKSENLINILQTIGTKVGITISQSDIDHIHRVRRFPLQNKSIDSNPSTSNVVVKFLQRQKKNEVLAAIKSRRGLTTTDLHFDGATQPIYVNEHLSPHNKLLLGKARKLRVENNYTFIWLKDCKIFVRKNETSKPIIITCEEDLKKIK